MVLMTALAGADGEGCLMRSNVRCRSVTTYGDVNRVCLAESEVCFLLIVVESFVHDPIVADPAGGRG